MKRSINSASLLLLLTLVSALSLNDVVSEGPREVENWLEALRNKKQAEKMTKMHFYYHDISGGQNATARVVARAANISSPFFFGVSAIADDPMTVGPEMMSKRVGYFKGLYGASSFEEVDLFMAMTFVFTDETYNGSSLSILGHNPYQHLDREIPVVGGSGRFRLARGVAMLKKSYSNQTARNFTVEVDIVVFHY